MEFTAKTVYTAYHRITGIPLAGDWDSATDANNYLVTIGELATFRVTPRKVYEVVAVPVKPLEIGEAVQVELVDGWHKATIVYLGPVLCYVELDSTYAKAAVTLSELAEWNR